MRPSRATEDVIDNDADATGDEETSNGGFYSGVVSSSYDVLGDDGSVATPPPRPAAQNTGIRRQQKSLPATGRSTNPRSRSKITPHN